MLLVAVLTVFIFHLILPTIQELIHWLLLVGVHVLIYKSDVDYGVILAFHETQMRTSPLVSNTRPP